MAKKPFLPRPDALLSQWLQNFSAKIGTYATKYNLSAAEVTAIQEACAFLIYWIGIVAQIKAAVQNITAYKNEVRDGVPAGGSPSVPPANITFSPPTAADPGVVRFILSIVARIKGHLSYTVADGEQLRIEGAEQVVDLANLTPEFTIKLENGHPNLDWTKGPVAEAVKIKVSRNAIPDLGPVDPGAFQFLAIDTQPGYVDTFQLPPFGTSVTWVYIMKYMIGDEEVGQWSQPQMITVNGNP